MLYRPLGRSGLSLSVIGFGSAWLRKVSDTQALDSLRTAFDLGINFVHTAPDYEGAEALVARAAAASGRNVIVASQGYGVVSHFEHLFETTCRTLGKHRLEMYGIACVDDREELGEDVWGPGGMVEFLKEKKREGRLQASFCTTHGSPEYVRMLIESGAFDGVMLAYNPLGYHTLSHQERRPGAGERLDENPALFELAERRGVGLILMKTLAGGLLARPKTIAFRDDTLIPPSHLDAGAVFRYLLSRHPQVTSLVPGMTSIAEVTENAAAGDEPIVVSEHETAAMDDAVSRLRSSVCSRCGYCDTLCSRDLRVSWMFRAAYIENTRVMVFETPQDLRYHDLHPEQPRAVCADCDDVTCRCPYGIDIPSSLIKVHGLMQSLLDKGQTRASPHSADRAPYATTLIGWERDEADRDGHDACCRLNFQNTGSTAWEMVAGKPKVALQVSVGGVLVHSLPVRSDTGPDVPCQFTFPFGPDDDGESLSFALVVEDPADATIIHREELGGLPRSTGSMYHARYLRHTVPAQVVAGATFRADVTIQNTSDLVWRVEDPASPLTLVAWVDGRCVDTVVLPGPVVKPGGRVGVTVGLPAPTTPGVFMATLGLVHQNLAVFGDRGVHPLQLRVVASDAPDGDAGPAPPWPEYDATFVAHRAPASVAPLARFCVALTIQNNGSFEWNNQPGSPRLVNLVLQHAGQVVGFARLPHAVPPRGLVDLHVTVAAPALSGPTRIDANLVHEGTALFSDRGVAPLALRLEVGDGPASSEDVAYETMRDRNAWFYAPSDGATLDARGTRRFPATIRKALGAHVWDGADRRLVDYTNAWGTALLGHAYEPVQEAVRAALSTGVLAPLPYALEADVTDLLRETFPSAECVAFGKNGSDVCTLAVRLARATTGRKTVLYCGFHGWQDWYVESFGMASTGVPEPDRPHTVRFRFNDLGHFSELLATHRDDLAAVMLEPSGPSGEPPYGVGPDVDPAFLRAIADATRAAGAVLIFDEIITGFRSAGGGVQLATGVHPDLSCFGKALANGMPLAALAGRRDLFRAMQRASYGPTYKGELSSLAAAKASLIAYRGLPVPQTVDRHGRALKDAITGLCRDLSIPATVAGPSWRFGLFFDDPDPLRRQALTTLYVQELLGHGLLPYKTLMLPSFAHGDDTLAVAIDACTRALRRVRCAIDDGDLHRHLDIPLIA